MRVRVVVWNDLNDMSGREKFGEKRVVYLLAHRKVVGRQVSLEELAIRE